MSLFIAGVFTGGIIFSFLFLLFRRSLLEESNKRITALENEKLLLRNDLETERIKRASLETELEKERLFFQEKEALLVKAEQALKDTFKSLSSDALKINSEQFINLAKTSFETIKAEASGDLEKRKEAIEGLVKPLQESLSRYEKQVADIENRRSEAYGVLITQVKAMSESQKKLEEETLRLADALSKPQVRGYWGEVQLRRIVEYAGMLEYCDFEPQVCVKTEDKLLRPDMLINLPGGVKIIIDAKTPLTDYQKAMATSDEETRRVHLQAHARTVRSHIKQLSDKQYWNQFESSPDFVIMFIPGEPFYLAALQEDPALIDTGADKKVILASPTSLIALLRVVALGWREEQLAKNAAVIRDIGKEMYERIVKLSEHIAKLGSHLKNSVSSYNDLIGTIETRVLVSARRFNDLGVEAHKEIPSLDRVELQARKLQAPEFDSSENNDSQ